MCLLITFVIVFEKGQGEVDGGAEQNELFQCRSALARAGNYRVANSLLLPMQFKFKFICPRRINIKVLDLFEKI